MSNTVTLTANNAGTQHCLATATVTDNGSPVNVTITWTTSDASVATVASNGVVVGVADPSGSGSRDATITATAVVNGNTVFGSGVATVVTTGDTVVVTVDFGAPQ